MEKLDGKTSDIVSENIAKMRELFPDIFSEDKIDFKKLRADLGDAVEESEEHYSFNWKGKQAAKRLAIARTTGTLRPVKEASKEWDTTENLYIEGDNLEVLRLLQESYRGKVKMIYIDPPYNTGSDFVYDDNFHEDVDSYTERAGEMLRANPSTSGRYHTNWLNMTYPRLRLAKNLLSDDGVIFISIDDNEQVNLKKLCDEVFGEANFIAQIIWKSKPQGGNDNKNIVTEHEYILVFAKSINSVQINGRQLDYNKYKLFDDHKEERGGYMPTKLEIEGLPYRINLDYPIECPDGVVIYPGGVDKKKWEERRNNGNKDHDWRWRWSKSRFDEAVKKDFVVFKKNDNKWTCYFKEYEFVDNDGNTIERSAKYRTVIDGITTIDGTRDAVDLLGGRLFSYPKPVDLIKHLLNVGSVNGDIILDFFSGSATTAHAVMELNAEDGGNRKFIMVQIPEQTPDDSEARKTGYKTIAEIGKKRIRLAGEKILVDYADKLKECEKPLDVGFKVFKLDTTNFTAWDERTTDVPRSLMDLVQSVKSERTTEDALYEILIKYGVDLSVPIKEQVVEGKKVYSIAGDYLLVCLEDKITLPVVEALAKMKPTRIVFRDAGFIDDAVKMNAEQTLKKHGVEDIRVI